MLSGRFSGRCWGEVPHLPRARWEPPAAQTVCSRGGLLRRLPVKVIPKLQAARICRQKWGRRLPACGTLAWAQGVMVSVPLPPGKRDEASTPAVLPFLTTFPGSPCCLLSLPPVGLSFFLSFSPRTPSTRGPSTTLGPETHPSLSLHRLHSRVTHQHRQLPNQSCRPSALSTSFPSCLDPVKRVETQTLSSVTYSPPHTTLRRFPPHLPGTSSVPMLLPRVPP